jgi:hypothetical protein
MCTDPESTSCASINYQVRMKRHNGCICQHWHWNCSHTVDPCSSSILISSLELLQRCNQVTWTVDFGILCTGMKSDQILPDSILTLKYGGIEAIRADAYLVWGLSLGQQHAQLAPHEFLNTFSMVRPLEICMQCENWVILELHFAPIVLSNSLPLYNLLPSCAWIHLGHQVVWQTIDKMRRGEKDCIHWGFLVFSKI